METRKQILTELQEIAPFLGKMDLSRAPYAVSTGYFAQFPEQLMKRIHLEASPGLNPSEEIHAISPLLAGIRNKNPYQVPAGYFDSLRAPVNTQPKKNKVISLPLRIVRYAAAACIVAMIGTVTYHIAYPREIADPIAGLNAVSDQDMANYLDTDDIHWTPGVSSLSETASVDYTDNDIHDLLSSVPDEELEQYSSALQQTKGTVN